MRRRILLLALLSSSVAAIAYSDASTAPIARQAAPKAANHDLICVSGYTSSTGEWVCTDWEER